MLGPPLVVRTRRPITRSLNVSEEGFAVLTDSVATPNVSLVKVHLVVECVVDSYIGSSCLINAGHDPFEIRTMSAVALADVQHKQVGVDHFVQHCLD